MALFGFGGSEFASANEVVNAIHQQNAPANDARPSKQPEALINEEQRTQLQTLIEATGTNIVKFCNHYKIGALPEMPLSIFADAKSTMEQKLSKLGKAA